MWIVWIRVRRMWKIHFCTPDHLEALREVTRLGGAYPTKITHMGS